MSEETVGENEIQRYFFSDKKQNIRVVIIKGEPWWVLKDVCDALSLANPSQVSARLDDTEKGVHSLDTPGGIQSLVIVNEFGLYTIVLRSDKPEAKQFRQWITHEVIPSIRKTGSYGDPIKALEDPSALRGLLLTYTDKVIELQSEVKDLKPKAEALDLISGSEGSVCFTDAAKMLKTSRDKLISYLTEKKWIYRRNGNSLLVAYQDKMQQLLLEMVDHPGGRDKFGVVRMFPQTKITQKGIARLAIELGGRGFTLFEA